MKNTLRKVSLWKWVLILILVVAMPLMFSYYRGMQTESAIQDTAVNAP